MRTRSRPSALAVTKPIRRNAVLCYLVAMMVGIAGCGTETEKTSEADNTADKAPQSLATDHSSPEALGLCYKTAFVEGDWATVIECITKESRGQFVSNITMVTDMAVIRDKQKRAVLDDLLQKHGVGESRHPDVFNEVSDKAALVADVIEFGKMNPPPSDSGMKGIGALRELWAQATFANFKVDGDTATADVIAPGQPVGFIDFRKVNDKWYNDPAATQMRRKSRQ